MRALYHCIFAGAFALTTGSVASAVVVRHDVAPERFVVDAAAYPQLVDMPGVGHGVLIAPQWVVTAAHVIQGKVSEVTIAGRARLVEYVVIHPGYRSTPQDMISRALASNDASEVMAFLAANHDIALVRLAQPVSDVAPAALYTGHSEMGKVVQFLGKGATGTGLTGVVPGSPQRGTLRRAFNRISAAEDRWITYNFDRGRGGHKLEGNSGSGDSGGPVLIKQNGKLLLAGLTSWQTGNPDLSVPSSRYGQGTVSVRLSYYADWIEAVQAGLAEAGKAQR